MNLTCEFQKHSSECCRLCGQAITSCLTHESTKQLCYLLHSWLPVCTWGNLHILGSSLEMPPKYIPIPEEVFSTKLLEKLLKKNNEWRWIILNSSNELLALEIWREPGDVILDKLLSDSKFRVLPTHSKSICFTHCASVADLWRGYLKEKKVNSVLGIWILKCLQCITVEMPSRQMKLKLWGEFWLRYKIWEHQHMMGSWAFVYEWWTLYAKRRAVDRGKNLGNTSLGKIIKGRVERRPLKEKVRWSSQNWKEESMGDFKKPIFFWGGHAVGYLNAVAAPRQSSL